MVARPAAARTIAAERPLGPEPMMVAVSMGLGTYLLDSDPSLSRRRRNLLLAYWQRAKSARVDTAQDIWKRRLPRSNPARLSPFFLCAEASADRWCAKATKRQNQRSWHRECAQRRCAAQSRQANQACWTWTELTWLKVLCDYGLRWRPETAEHERE